MTQESQGREALDKIAKVVDDLEDTLKKLKGSDNKLEAWYEQKRAVHEIKKILSESTDYAGYNSEEYDAFIVEYNDYIKNDK